MHKFGDKIKNNNNSNNNNDKLTFTCSVPAVISTNAAQCEEFI